MQAFHFLSFETEKIPDPMKRIVIMILAAVLLVGCHSRQHSEEEVVNTFDLELPPDQQAFLENLAGLCGKSFPGKETFVAQGRESWAGEQIMMHVTYCENNQVHIQLHVGEDRSRTWMFLDESGLLRLRHDHRHPDGTPEDPTLYGGYAQGKGTPFIQSFPADDYTLEALENPEYEREWVVGMDPEMTTLTYQLQYKGEVVHQLKFDLTQTLEDNP